MLNNLLNTNEVKNSAGAEVEFQRLSTSDRETIFAVIGEAPALPHRFNIKHVENGVDMKRRRRSLVRFDKTVISTVDLITPVTFSSYHVFDAPVGAMLAMSEGANVIAESMSFLASLGLTTTILYDCTGNGAKVLLEGSL